MISLHELERFQSCVRDAWEFAGQGHVEEGWEWLDLGLVWAESLPPGPGAAALVSLYQEALLRYAREHELILGSRRLIAEARDLRRESRRVRAEARQVCAEVERVKQRFEKLRQAGFAQRGGS